MSPCTWMHIRIMRATPVMSILRDTDNMNKKVLNTKAHSFGNETITNHLADAEFR